MFTVRIDTDNDAFDPDPGPEIARILYLIALSLNGGWTGNDKFQTIMDVDGNDVGRWRVTK